MDGIKNCLDGKRLTIQKARERVEDRREWTVKIYHKIMVGEVMQMIRLQSKGIV